MASSGMLRHVALVRTYVSEEVSASIIRVTRIGELGTLAVTSHRSLLPQPALPQPALPQPQLPQPPLPQPLLSRGPFSLGNGKVACEHYCGNKY
jgi:hypothetical protein